ncbi:MAG: DUF4012 domain-containing protein [Patescibacteria group bacterium]
MTDHSKIIDLRKKKIQERITKKKVMIDVVSASERKDLQQAQETIFMHEESTGKKSKSSEREKNGSLMAIGLIGFVFIVTLNLASAIGKGQRIFSQVSHSTFSGYEDLLNGGQKIKQGNVGSAKNFFEQAKQSFAAAVEEIWFFQKDAHFEGVTSIVDVGASLSHAGLMATEAADIVENLKKKFSQKDVPLDQDITQLEKLSDSIDQDLRRAIEGLESIDQGLMPANYFEKFTSSLTLLKKTQSKVEEILGIIPGIKKFLGVGRNGPQEILVLLQNNDEIRPTGGFIGSYLKIQTDKGRIKEMKLEDVYDIDDPFKGVIEPPEEIKKFGTRWFFRDANYSPDFAVSGKKALWLYAQETANSKENKPQTILAINQSLLGKMLEITGPITLDSLKYPISSDNYREVLTYMIEAKVDGDADPKKVLKNLFPILQQKLAAPDLLTQIEKITAQEIVSKNIFGYSNDEDIEHLFTWIGMDGKLQQTGENEDYLALSMTSFGGNKSEANIRQILTHSTLIEQSGEVVDELVIERAHLWSPQLFAKIRNLLTPFNLKDFPDHLVKILGSGDNKVAVRVYVPDGSALQNAEGIDIEKVATHTDPETQKTYFAFDMLTETGKIKSITLRYTLPFLVQANPTSRYRFFIQKQAGMKPVTFIKNIYTQPNLKLLKQFPEKLKKTNQKIHIEYELNKDEYLATLWGKGGE